MIKATIPNQSNAKSLTAQIRDAERQVLIRQGVVGVRADTLVRKIHQQMTAPATLLLAGGIGFIIGEITKRQFPKFRDSAGKPRAAGTTPLSSVLNFVSSAHTLYSALPLVWMMKSFRQPGVPDSKRPNGDSSLRQRHPIAEPSGSVYECPDRR